MSSLSQFYGATNVSVVKSIQKFWITQERSFGSGTSKYYAWATTYGGGVDLVTGNFNLSQTVNPDKTSISFWLDHAVNMERYYYYYSHYGIITEIKINNAGTKLQVSGYSRYGTITDDLGPARLYVELIEYY